MGLDGVFADEEIFCDLAVAHALGHELEDVAFTAGEAEVFSLAIVGDEWLGRGDRDLLDNDLGAPGGESQTEPDAKGSKTGGDKGSVDFDGVVEDEEAVLRPLQQGNEDTANQSVDENVPLHSWEDDAGKVYRR